MQIAERLNRRGQAAEAGELAPRRQLTHIVYVILRDPLALFSVVIIAAFILVAVLGPWLAPYPEQGYGKTNVATRMLPMSREYPFGTDRLGRDLLSRVIIAARPALLVSLGVVAIAILIGAPLGALAGYAGGRLDDLIVAALGPGLEHAALALAISWWPWYTRLVRGMALSLRQRYFVEAARSIGVPVPVIIFQHILPNCLSPILVQATVDIGTVILATSGLAFIGLGAQPPAPDWGLMVNEGRTFILDQWWYSTFPGLAIFVTVLAFNLLGDTLRDIFDPRQYR
jgi:peptide/nickel transport system permease protein